MSGLFCLYVGRYVCRYEEGKVDKIHVSRSSIRFIHIAMYGLGYGRSVIEDMSMLETHHSVFTCMNT